MGNKELLLTSKQFCSQPYALIRNSAGHDTHPEHVARELAHRTTLVYNGILRGLNSGYNHADKIDNESKATKLAFLRFNQCLYDIINFEIVTVANKHLFEHLKVGSATLIKEQEGFEDALRVYKEYIYSAEASVKELKGQKLRALIDAFAPSLREYLVHHIAWILTQGKLEHAYCKKLTLEIYQMSARPLESDVLQLFLMCLQDRDYLVDGRREVFPDLPWWKCLYYDWTLAREHQDMLSFAPSDCYGHRQAL